jgi:dipeptidyl aminopeptidase/acylaminoacyl peptidase
VDGDATTLEEDRVRRDMSARSGLTGVTVDGDLWPRSRYRFGREVLKLIKVSLSDDPAEPQLMDVQLGEGILLSGQVALTPDGRRCAAGLVRFLPGGHRRYGLLLFALNAPGRSLQVWTEDDLSDTIVSPNGAWFACTAERIAVPGMAPRQEAVLVSSDGLAVRRLAQHHRDWLQPRAWQDAQTLLCTGEQGGQRHLWRVDVASQDLTSIDCGGSVRSVTTNLGEALVVRSSIASPPSVIRVPAVRAAEVPAVRAVFAPASRAEPSGQLERLTYTSADGARWSSWLCLPERIDRSLPVLVWCHGGPMLSWSDWSWRWNPWPFVADGYAVLMLDPPLSTGYGQAAIQRGWGKWTSEVAPVAAAQVAEALLDVRLDGNRIAVMGASFGGYLSLALGTLLHQPRLIVSHCGWADFAAVARACDLHWHWLREYGSVDESPSYRRESLSLSSIPMNTKVLLSHGCDDDHVPVGEARAMFRTLQARGLDVDLTLFPDEEHSIIRPANAAAWHRWVSHALAQAMDPERDGAEGLMR